MQLVIAYSTAWIVSWLLGSISNSAGTISHQSRYLLVSLAYIWKRYLTTATPGECDLSSAIRTSRLPISYLHHLRPVRSAHKYDHDGFDLLILIVRVSGAPLRPVLGTSRLRRLSWVALDCKASIATIHLGHHTSPGSQQGLWWYRRPTAGLWRSAGLQMRAQHSCNSKIGCGAVASNDDQDPG